jgi:DNA (cytosine-5)-methyltransferase 3A
MKVLSLFDGISCGMIALERAGIKVDRYKAYEIDENAIKISDFNYPQIERGGDVFNAEYTEGEFDLLIGGSPCTYWSVARTRGGRELTSSGLGWDLFSQYVRALREVKPKYFLYENNASINADIKVAISNELGVEPIMINSSLLSAQGRKRCYWTNIPFDLPKDKGIKLTDVIDFSTHEFRPIGKWCLEYWGDKRKIDGLKTIYSEKSHTLTTSKTHPMNYYLNDDKTEYCNLTVNDWEKLQTLPEGYCDNVPTTNGAKYKAIGNGWTVDVIAHILKNIPNDNCNIDKLLESEDKE